MDRTKQKSQNTAPPTKYYRVILEAIDSHRETKESFALKLSMQTRTPVTRITAVVNNMPCPIKTGLSMSQAKKFSTVLEEFGGIVSIAEYVVSKGDSDPALNTREEEAAQTSVHPIETVADQGIKSAGESIVCSNCGWENNGEVEFCAFCYARFGDQPPLRPLSERLPDENPLVKYQAAEDEPEDITVKKSLPLSMICVLGGLAVILIWIISRY